MDVLCIGKTTIDQFVMINQDNIRFRLDRSTGYLSFKHGEKIDVEELNFCLGGNATNVAVGLSRLGLSAGLCTEIGDDEFAGKIHNELEKEKIDRSYMLVTKDAPSSFSVIINFRGERTIFIQKVTRKHEFKFGNAATKYVFLTSLEREWRDTYEQAIALLVKRGCKLVFNPGTLQLHEGRDIVTQILEHTDILFVNKEEAEELVFGHERRKRINEMSYIRELMVKLHKMGAKTAVVTNGRFGSHAIDEYGNFYHEGLYPGEIVERTGAGDGYTSGFLSAILYKKSIKEAMKWGAINSTSVIGKVGAVAGLLGKEIMEKRDREAETFCLLKRRKMHPVLEFAIEKFRMRRENNISR